MEDITGIILAGGKGQRLGGIDKGLLNLHGKPLIEYAMAMLQPHVKSLLISANRQLDVYARYGVTVIRDANASNGPLCGIASALAHVHTRYAMTIPCDCPFLPADLVLRMYQELTSQHADIAVAHDGERLQSVCLLFNTSLKTSLDNYLADGDRQAHRWVTQQHHVTVDFSLQKGSFMNINTQEEYALAESHIKPFSGLP